MTKLVLAQLTKKRGNNTVLHGISLELMPHSFNVVVGPSGCGKSTLLRLIAGLDSADSGSIHLDEIEVGNLTPKERNIGLVFQNFALYPHMSVRKNLSYGLRISGQKSSEIDKRVASVAAMLGIEDLLDRRPDQLSGGQQQRVAIGRAIIRTPSILLFDEPFSSLDAALRASMRLEIRKIHRQSGATTLFVTHDQAEAMALADYLIVMQDGRIEQAGPPGLLYSDPRNVFVAGFLGDPGINLIAGQRDHEGFFHLHEGMRLPVKLPDWSCGNIIMGIRPEHIAMSNGGLPMQVDVVERLGKYNLVHGKVGAAAISLMTSHSFDDTEMIKVEFPAAKLLFFDGYTGGRLRAPVCPPGN